MKRAAKRVAAPVECAVWRDGVQIVGTPIWCDARKTRDVCFLSHAGVPFKGKHETLIMTQQTMGRLGLDERGRRLLAPRYSRPFSLGDLRVELYPSGLSSGAASLVVDVKGERVAYAGSVAPGVSQPDWEGELRAADALILDTRWSGYNFPTRVQLRAELDALVAANPLTVLFLEARSTALQVLAGFGDRPTYGHASFYDDSQYAYMDDHSITVPSRLGNKLPSEGVVFWPLDRPLRMPGGKRVLVDASAVDPGRAARFDHAIAWNDRAGRDDLLTYVQQTGARTLYALGGADPAFAAATGIRVVELGPAAQLSLF